MEKKELIIDYCHRFKLGGILAELGPMLMEAETGQISYTDYTIRLLSAEATYREAKDLVRRSKAAKLPAIYDLDQYDYAVDNRLSKTRLMQLSVLNPK